MGIKEDLERLREETLSAISSAVDLAALEEIRIKVLGKKGSLTKFLRSMQDVPKELKPEIGKLVNTARNLIDEAIDQRLAILKSQELEKKLQSSAIDTSLPGRANTIGSQHLINNIIEEVSDIFSAIGYSIVPGTEVETDYYNFTALNAPKDHPSRSTTDTFYIMDGSENPDDLSKPTDFLLRTQTSGTQVHVMETQKPPIYMISPGKVYRRDVADPSHLPQFNQIEGLVVDEGISFAHLKGTLEYFVKQFFGPDREVRLRAHFFPFTEPSAEMDISCGVCHGDGCRFCKNTGWVEILGCGMVDPNVFEYVGIDTNKYSGFAFGVGVERLACLRYNIPDLRILLEGDMRFLRQY